MARLAVTVDLPTPPLPEATAITLAMPPVVVGTRSRPALLDHDEHLRARKRLAQKRFGLVLDLHGERVAGLGEAQHDGDFAFGGRRMFDKSARNDVLSGFRVDDRCEQAFDFFFHCRIQFLFGKNMKKRNGLKTESHGVR